MQTLFITKGKTESTKGEREGGEFLYPLLHLNIGQFYF